MLHCLVCLLLTTAIAFTAFAQDGVEVRQAASTVASDSKSLCDQHFDENKCQKLIDEAGPARRHQFLDCSKGAFDTAVQCGGSAGIGFMVSTAIPTKVAHAVGRVSLPVFGMLAGAYAVDWATKGEQRCYEATKYKEKLLEPMTAYFGKSYTDALMNKPCHYLEGEMYHFVKRVKNKIGSRQIVREAFARDLKRVAPQCSVEQVEKFLAGQISDIPCDKNRVRRISQRHSERLLTDQEKVFQEALAKVDEENLALLRDSQEFIRKKPCRSWSFYTNAICGMAGGIGGATVGKRVVRATGEKIKGASRLITGSGASRPSPLAQMDTWVDEQLTQGDSLATWKNIQTMSRALARPEKAKLEGALLSIVNQMRRTRLSDGERKQFYNIMVSLENSLKNISSAKVGSAEHKLGMARIREKMKILQDIVDEGGVNSQVLYQRLQECMFGQVCSNHYRTMNAVVVGTHAQARHSVGHAVDYATNQFRGVAYSDDAAHIAGKRFCGYLNCTIFSERVTGMVRSKTPEQVNQQINLIRYGNRPVSDNTYLHMPSSWLRESQRLGVTRDITTEVGGGSTKYMTRTIDQGAFLKWKHSADMANPNFTEAKRQAAAKSLRQLPRDITQHSILQRRTLTLPYVPTNQLLASPGMVRSIPNGARFATVVDSRSMPKDFREITGSDLMVEHVGFIIQRNGQTYIRHSSKLFDNQVREDLFEEYVRKYLSGHRFRRGMHFEEILPN